MGKQSAFLALSTAILGLAAAATAAPPPPAASPPAATARPAPDSSRIVCEYQEILGSRLGGKKVCKTAGEWAEMRSSQQLHIERAQQTGASAHQ